MDFGPELGSEWRRAGPFVGQWITRRVLSPDGGPETFSVGKIVGYLSAEESDYFDTDGKAAALFRVNYASGVLGGDCEDLEEWPRRLLRRPRWKLGAPQ